MGMAFKKMNRLTPDEEADAELDEAPEVEAENPLSPVIHKTFFPHPILLQRLDLLKYLTQCSDLVILVSGVQGSGKTRLLHEFLSIKQDSWHLCAIQADASMEATLLPGQVYEGFGLPAQSDAVMFGDYLEDLGNVGQLALLVVDDAQELSIDALLALLCIPQEVGDAGKNLRILLFAEPIIEAALKGFETSLGERILQRMDMPRYSLEETRSYIQHRYVTADFSFSEMAEVFQQSDGIPGAIQAVAEQLLAKQEMQQETKAAKAVAVESIKPEAIKKVTPRIEPATEDEEDEEWEEDVVKPFTGTTDLPQASNKHKGTPYIYIVGGVVAVLAAFWFQEDINKLFLVGTDAKNQTALDAGRIPIQLPDRLPLKKVVVDGGEPSGEAEAPMGAGLVLPEGEFPVPEVAAPISAPAPAVPMVSEKAVLHLENAGQKEQGHEALQKQTAQALPVPESAAKVSESKKPELKKSELAVVVSTADQVAAPVVKPPEASSVPAPVAPKPSQAETVAPEKSAEDKAAAVQAAQKQAAIVAPTPEPAVKAEPVTALAKTPDAPGADSIAGVKDPDWLLAQDGSYYVVQLLSTRNQDMLASYTRQYGLSGQVAYMRTRDKGKNWYKLLYGLYPNQKTAKAGIKQLPKGIVQSSVWLRSVSSVQKDIRNAQ